MPTDAQEPTASPAKLTTQQQRFIEEYCVDWNGTQAAIRAGYSAKTSYSTGSRLLKVVEIKAAIDARLKDLSLSAGQVTKHISDIAETRLNDFLVVHQVQGYAMESHYLSVLKQRALDEIEYIQIFATEYQLPLADMKGGATATGLRLAQAREKLLSLELEILAHGPDAVKLVPGKPIIQEVADLDLVALARAKVGGRLKSFSHTKEGIKVETYAADAALRDLGRIHGIFEKDNSQGAATAVINAKVEIVATGKTIARAESEVSGV